MSTSNSGTFSAEEREAMKARAKELALEAKSAKKRSVGEKALQDAIVAMSEPDKTLAKKIHEIVSKVAPQLWPKTWYGFPAYTKDDKVVCFFQFAGKFESRYATIGFNDVAKLDDGNMWPTAFAVTKITEKEEQQIAELVKRAVS